MGESREVLEIRQVILRRTVVIFEDIPYGIKIHSKLLATMMHFLVEKLQMG
jgi:hypothetical protein